MEEGSKKWTIAEMQSALVLLRSLIPQIEIRRIMDEVMEENWSVLSTPTGDIAFQRDDLSLLGKLLED